MDAAVVVEERAGALWARLNRPERLNALDAVALRELRAAIGRAAAERPVALVITASGRAFSAGADLAWLRSILDDASFAERVGAFLTEARETIDELVALPIPTIAGVNGVATAGGMELICACDLVVASTRATIADGHANFGLMPVAGSARRLAARVGLSNAKRLLFTGAQVDAAEAYRIGLVNWLVEPEALDPMLGSICADLTRKSPLVLEAMKTIADRGIELDDARASELELSTILAHLETGVVQEGLRAFVEKRAPRFR